VAIEGLLIEKRKAKGVKLAGFEGMIASRYMIWNQPTREIETWLPKNFLSRWLIRRVKKIQPKFNRFSLQYKVDPEVIPVGMKGNVLYVKDPKQPLTGPNFLHLHFYSPTQSVGSKGQRRFIVTYLLETEALNKPESDFLPIHDAVIRALHDL